MTYGDIPGELTERVLIEYLRHQTHSGEYLDFLSIGGSYTRAFLAAVLESKQGEEGNSGNVFTWGIHSENATSFVHFSLPDTRVPDSGNIVIIA